MTVTSTLKNVRTCATDRTVPHGTDDNRHFPPLYSLRWGSPQLLGECRALWGERERAHVHIALDAIVEHNKKCGPENACHVTA